MRVINLGLDNKILDNSSAVAKRAISYAELLEKYLVVVPGEDKDIKLSSKVRAIGINANNKFQALFKMYKYLDKHLKEIKYDLITIQDAYYIGSIGVNLANKYGIKIEIQVHGFEKLSSFRYSLAKYNLQRADIIRTVSTSLKNRIVDEFGIKEEKIYVSPVAVDKNKILNFNSNLNLKEKHSNNFIFLTVSRLVEVKNISLQLKALSKVENANLIIVGDGPEKNNLINLTKELNIEDRVEFVGWVDDVYSYYKSSDCLLLTSDSEGYGMVVAEAVLASLPVIMTDVGVAGELVKDGINGLIVPIRDQAALEKAMLKIVSDNGLLKSFSDNSIQFQNMILDKEELITKIVNNWKKICNV